MFDRGQYAADQGCDFDSPEINFRLNTYESVKGVHEGNMDLVAWLVLWPLLLLLILS